MAKASQTLIRMREPLKAQLVAAAVTRGTSANQEIVRRLEESVQADDRLGGPDVQQVVERMTAAFLHGGRLGAIACGIDPNNWIHDRRAFDVAAAAVIDELRGIGDLTADVSDPKAVGQLMDHMIARQGRRRG
jgi:hypothetical protein